MRSKIRTPVGMVETRLARAMLGGEVAQGDRIRIGWDSGAEQLRIEPATAGEPPASSTPAAEGSASPA